MDDHEFCLRCGRRLKNPVARERGYGNVCYLKMVVERGTRLFGTIEALPSDSPQVPSAKNRVKNIG